MPDKPVNPTIEVSPHEASRILTSWLRRETEVNGLRRLTGGCVNTVVRVDYDDGAVVLKLSHRLMDAKLDQECEVLQHFERVPAFRVPRVLHRDISGKIVPYSFYIMEYLPGVNLADTASHLPVDNRILIERQMGEAVAGLHQQKRDRFGPCVGGEGFERWSDCFLDRFDQTTRDLVEGQLLDLEVLRQVDTVRQVFPRLIDTDARPTLTHGDIWATNIILSPGRGMWSLLGFVDPGGLYAHPEFELAYLDIWSTVGRAFHETYRHCQPVEEGYELRRLFYWLHTLLRHVRAFKSDYYREATASLAGEMSRLIRRKGR